MKRLEIPMDNAMSFALTPLQKKMWIATKYFPRSAAYNIPAAIEIKGKIIVDCLRKCLVELVHKHAALQFKIKIINDEPIQWLDNDTAPKLQIFSVSSQEELTECLVKEASTPFDIDNNPLFRFILWQLSDNHAILQLTLHHIISDRYSLSILIKDIFEIYNRYLDGKDNLEFEPSALSFGEYLSTYPYASLIPVQPSPNYQEYLASDFASTKNIHMFGKIKWSSIEGDLFAAIKLFAVKNRTRPFIVLLSAFKTLLYRYSFLEDITVAVPFSERDHRHSDTVGMFVKTNVINSIINPRHSFLDIIHATNSNVYKLMANTTQAEVANSVFQCMLIYEGNDFDYLENSQVNMRLFLVDHNQAKFPLSLYIYQSDNKYKLRLEYNTDIFLDETMAKFLLHFKNLLLLLINNPNESVSKIEYLDAAEKDLLLSNWNNTTRNFTETPFIHEIVARFADKFPQKLAVVFENESLTYFELNSLANQLAKKMLELNVAHQNVVAAFFDKSIEMLVSILAIHKIAAIYLPLDKSYLSDRLVSILKHAQPTLILSDNENIFSDERIKTINVQAFVKAHIKIKDTANVQLKDLKRSDPAYIIYTSGSTGNPKGVIISHDALYNRIAWMQDEYAVSTQDSILHKTSIMFDVSIWEIFLPLFSGCTLVIAKPSGNRDSAYLKSLIAEKKITLLHFVPIMLEDFLQNSSLKTLDSLRHVFCSGEALNASTVKKFYDLMPQQVKLHNLYGPTEATVDVTYHYCDPLVDYYKAVPIGKPIWNTALYILDHNLQPVPINIPGELYISGIAIAQGYLKDEVLTKERFIPNMFMNNSKMYKTGDLAKWTFAGEMIFLGRTDRQIKINGIRIEAAEIENNINRYPTIHSSYVIKTEVSTSQYQLVAYLQLNKNARLEEDKLRDFLLTNLPIYMVPAIFVRLDFFPLTNSGKVDVNKLPSFKNAIKKNDLPSALSVIESKIIGVWQEVLKVEKITIHDNFFLLGGDSIKSVTVVAKLKALGFNISVDKILSFPTVKALAKIPELLTPIIASTQYEPFQLLNASDKANLPKDIVNAYPLSQLQLSLVYHSEASKAYNIYVTTYKIQSEYNPSLLEKALELSILKHPILRMYFDIAGYSEPLQLVKNAISIKISVINLTEHSSPNTVVKEYINTERMKKFDWEVPPLFRFCVHIFNNNLFHFTISEPCLDGWSVALLAQDIFSNYRHLMLNKNYYPPFETPCDYSHFIANEKAAIQSSEYTKFWQTSATKIQNSVLIDKKIDLHHSITDIIRIEEELDVSLTKTLKIIPLQFNIPLKTVLFATHCIAISTLLNSKTITTGLMSNCRPEIQGSEKLIGMFLNVLPITTTISDDFVKFLNTLYSTEQEHIKYRLYPYSKIVNKGVKNRFDTLFNFTDFYPYQDFTHSDDFKLLSIKGTDQTLFNLTAQYSVLQTNSNIRVALDFNNMSEDFDYLNQIKNCYIRTIRYFCEKLMRDVKVSEGSLL